MTTSKLQWKIKGLAKGLDPNVVLSELERIENVYGGLTAQSVLEAASPEDSILHVLFEWDDSEAAKQYRLQQARTILNNIEVQIIGDGEGKTISVFELVTIDSSRVYKNISSFGRNEIDQVRLQTIKSLNILKNKLNTYNGFSSVIGKLGDVIEELKIAETN